ncbi:hypothetical protein [Christiangramia portivictoriae]|uniref:hypothetical protein n=1 Tax=Christiangramia portivictoriae TaxID=326069 RepID=UPI00047AC151|nr:hypothetical protein [Christiangramia portivictoriae]
MKYSSVNKRSSAGRTRLLAIWTALWVASLALLVFGNIFLWEGNTTITAVLLIINFLLGIGMIVANIKHLESLDELQRKIHLEAMGISLGIALVLGISYSTMDVTNLITFDAEISHLVIVIGISYFAGVVIGQYRYR